MSVNRCAAGLFAVAFVLGVVCVPARAAGQGGETIGVITEIKVRLGRVEVKPAGTGEWRQAGPLLALRPGDVVRATENASVVVLLTGGRGSVRVDAARSPYVLPAPQPGESKTQKVRGLVESSLRFLASGAKEPLQAALATRGRTHPSVILSPRNGPLLPDSLSFEWLASRFSRYTITIVGPAGPILERKGLAETRFEYPSDAPSLVPGVRYRFQVLSGNHPPQEAWFEILDPDRAQAIRRDMSELEQSLGTTVSANSLAALKVGFLASEGLIHDARLSLIAALTKDPDEPTLHLLLGNLYIEAGLPEMAAEAYDEARFLVTRPEKSAEPARR